MASRSGRASCVRSRADLSGCGRQIRPIAALFVANSLAEQADVDTLARGVELAIRITEAPSLARLVKRRVLPKPGLEKDAERAS